MGVFFRRRGSKPLIPLTITGSGNDTNCYLIYDGEKHTSAEAIKVSPNGIVTFGFYGTEGQQGWVSVNGTKVKASSNGADSFDWAVPRASAITVDLSYYVLISPSYGRIAVTTV